MLTTLTKARLLGIDPTGEIPDEELTALLIVASTAIEEKCRRRFKLQEYNGQVNGMRGQYLYLPNYPVHYLSIYERPDHPFIDVETLDNGIFFRRCGWPGGERGLSVTYTAGYVLPEDATEDTPSTLPETLEYACVLMVKHLQREPGIASERVGDISVAYAAAEADMPMAVKALIAPHIRPEL
ncbi:phage gp6-like head-tail connector protein [Paenibacillus sp. 19GGS1-52]|uniref:phage gp6-like head-tail connector protein n=1 Tax=Paenibacillus sp. 19GGS1-52 TaxID=2758563 RepID=UPI001EFA5F2B|nr:phage gp6-like head-tail connector protein [Paenibacillus sp. 19GGS1-52]ULO08930.1 phage gp6-like head-tail connector protein [Paenibacillus sp. 19GGS1-52]